MQTSKYRLRTSKESPIYRSRENSREMSLYNREELLYREDSYGSERILRERGRSRTLRVPSLERSDKEQERRLRERSVSEDYRNYRNYRDIRSKNSESKDIRNQEGDCYKKYTYILNTKLN